MASLSHYGGPPAVKETDQSQSQSLSEENIHVELTHEPLNITATLDRVRSPKAGALVLFAGTTRDNFDSKPVVHLSYTSYPPLALQTLLNISRNIRTKHSLLGISVVHRLGTCPVGEESILIAVSASHRKAAWDAGEECLEMVKDKAEIWKLETFEGGEGVWRANRDGQKRARVDVDKEAGLEGGFEGIEGNMENPQKVGQKVVRADNVEKEAGLEGGLEGIEGSIEEVAGELKENQKKVIGNVGKGTGLEGGFEGIEGGN